MKLEELIKETKSKELEFMVKVNDFAKKHKLTQDLVPNVNRGELGEDELNRIMTLYGEHGNIFRSFDDDFDFENFEDEIQEKNNFSFYIEVNAFIPWNDNLAQTLLSVRKVDNHFGEKVDEYMVKLVKDEYPNETKPLDVFGGVELSDDLFMDVDYTEIVLFDRFMSITYLEWYVAKA